MTTNAGHQNHAYRLRSKEVALVAAFWLVPTAIINRLPQVSIGAWRSTYATVSGIRRFSYLGKHGHHRCHECHDMDERKQQYLAVRIRSCPPQCQLFNVTGFLIFPAARQQTTRVAPQNRKLNSCGSVVFVAALGQSRDGSGSFFADGEIAWWCGENAHRIW